jgi:hypothetical protein
MGGVADILSLGLHYTWFQKHSQSQTMRDLRVELANTKIIANFRNYIEQAIKQIKKFNILSSPGG